VKIRKVLITTAIALTLAVPSSVFAATSTSSTAVMIRGLFGIDSSKLTAAQLADVTDYSKKMADLQKSLLDKMVSNGAMTQAQADIQKAQIDSNLANGDVFTGGGHGQKGLNYGFGGNIDTSKLTDDQKNTLLALQKEQLTLEKDLTKILVEQQIITQTQADAINTKVDAAIAALSTSSSTHDLLRGNLGGFGMFQGVTLTDAQKTAILGWTSNAATVQKKIVSFYKDAGLITQAQADASNTLIDARAKDPLSFTMMGNYNRGGGKMGGRHGR
jgi:Protein of unknown function (DUF2680).